MSNACERRCSLVPGCEIQPVCSLGHPSLPDPFSSVCKGCINSGADGVLSHLALSHYESVAKSYDSVRVHYDSEAGRDSLPFCPEAELGSEFLMEVSEDQKWDSEWMFSVRVANAPVLPDMAAKIVFTRNILAYALFHAVDYKRLVPMESVETRFFGVMIRVTRCNL